MTLSTEHEHQLMFLLVWSLQAFIAQMESIRNTLWIHERMASFLIWHVTSPGTFAPSYVASATSAAVVALAEERKNAKHGHLDLTYSFYPVVVESTRVIHPQSWTFQKDLGHCLGQVIRDERSCTFLL